MAGIIEVQPPKTRRGRQPIVIPVDEVTEFYQALEAGTKENPCPFVSDGQSYETRSKAASTANRFKAALVDNGHYANTETLRTRVWNTAEGDADDTWVFALGLKPGKAKTASK